MGYWTGCASFSQQAVEVAVRAMWMEARHAELPQDHKVDCLAADLGIPSELVDEVREMTHEDAMYSYPPDMPGIVPREFTDEEATDWIDKAERVIHWLEAN